MKTIRQELIDLLQERELDAREISRILAIKEKEVLDHLTHIGRTLSARGLKLRIEPAECQHCGYVFKERRRYSKPGRCPRCKKTHILAPGYHVEEA